MSTSFDTPAALAAASGTARALREHYLRDAHRPGYHFVVPEGIHAPVDPNGALFWNGRYHLFYIYQEEGKHCWGHISSLDMLHWRHHVPGLLPDDRDEGIFSGGAFVDQQGVATITYWGLGQPDGICLATSVDPQLDTWTKNPANPVIAATQFGFTEAEADGKPVVYGAADPSQVWWHEGHYYMLTGSLPVLNEFGNKRGEVEHQGDTVYLLRSSDLTNWTYLHRFYTSRREWTAASEDDMCPDFFPLPSSPAGGSPSDKHLLLFISHNMGCQYYVGSYADHKFEPQSHGRMTWVDNLFFAPESLTDSAGRRIMWSWIFDRRSAEVRDVSGWSGELSLPRVLWLGEGNTLCMQPAEELQRLRYNPVKLPDQAVGAGESVVLAGISGDSLEITVTLQVSPGGRAGLRVLISPDGRESTGICYDDEAGTLSIDTSRSSLGEGDGAVETAPLHVAPGEALQLRVFIDKSIIEVFANDRQAVVRRVYTTLPDSKGTALFADCGALLASEITAWEMMPCNPY